MYPIILQKGPVTIFSLWIFLAIAFFTAFLILINLSKRKRLKMQFLVNHSLAIFFGGLILSRIIHVIYNFNFYFYEINLNSFLGIFYIWDKGLSLWGAIFGVAIVIAYFAFKEKEDFKTWLDVLSVSVLGGLSVGNIGAFLDGSNYGSETSLPWGVIIENSIYAVPIHPTQIYAAIYTALLAIILYKLSMHKIGKDSGNIALIAVASYSLFRFLEDFLRGDESIIILGLRDTQIYALLAIIISGILFYVKFKKTNTT